MFLLSTGEMTGALLVSSVDVLDGPWMSTVTWTSMDTLTEGCTLCVYVPGWSMAVHSYLGIHGLLSIQLFDGMGLSMALLDNHVF